jgi:hypothetical protein
MYIHPRPTTPRSSARHCCHIHQKHLQCPKPPQKQQQHAGSPRLLHCCQHSHDSSSSPRHAVQATTSHIGTKSNWPMPTQALLSHAGNQKGPRLGRTHIHKGPGLSALTACRQASILSDAHASEPLSFPTTLGLPHVLRVHTCVRQSGR